MGINPKFGNFILLATVLIDAEVSEQSLPIDYNPCLGCRVVSSGARPTMIGLVGLAPLDTTLHATATRKPL
jgi:epoxyqueuosine reductase